MLIQYLSFYLIFVIVAAVLVSLITLKFKFPAPHIVVPLVIAMIILPALFVYLYITYFTALPEVGVPDLKGLSLEEAFVRLEASKLKSRHAGKVFDMKYPEGKVVSQRPEAGRRVKVGRTVYLLTSSGKQRVVVPNLLGRPVGQAEAVLSAKGLFLGRMDEDVVPELDAGIILTQMPLPGEEVNVASSVSITVSASPEAEAVEEGGEGAGTGAGSGAGTGKKKDEGGFWPWW